MNGNRESFPGPLDAYWSGDRPPPHRRRRRPVTRVLALAGGVGVARLARGLARLLAPDELLIAVNTGDDFRHLGLHIAPCGNVRAGCPRSRAPPSAG